MDKMRELANAIVETFEEVLDRYDVTLPSSEDDEREQGNTARLYGMTYYGLLDAVEALIADYCKDVKSEQAEKVKSEQTAFDLVNALRACDDVVAVQLWLMEDLENAADVLEMELNETQLRLLADRSERLLEDCSHGWEQIYSVAHDLFYPQCRNCRFYDPLQNICVNAESDDWGNKVSMHHDCDQWMGLCESD